MSLSALAYCFDLRLPANEKWLMVCLADCADPWGESVFPSLDTLEERTGMSRSTLKRTFARVLERGILQRLAPATPVSPAFYRIVGVPEPLASKLPPAPPSCPNALRRAVIFGFGATCEYCKRASGSGEVDPDGKSWTVDRIHPGARGGIYSPDNVTLSCRSCNQKKRTTAAPAGTRSLSDLHLVEKGQIEPSPETTQGVHIEPSVGGQSEPSSAPAEASEGVHPEPSGGFNLTRGRVHGEPRSVIDPVLDPEKKEQGAAPPTLPSLVRRVATTDDPNMAVIIRLAHDVIDRLGAHASISDLADGLKYHCAQHRVPLTPDAVTKAIDAAHHQRSRRRA